MVCDFLVVVGVLLLYIDGVWNVEQAKNRFFTLLRIANSMCAVSLSVLFTFYIR